MVYELAHFSSGDVAHFCIGGNTSHLLVLERYGLTLFCLLLSMG